MVEKLNKLFDGASVFVGIFKATNGESVLAFSSLSESIKEVKNKIYYQIEKANIQFNLEKAWENLSKKWTIVGGNLKRAEGFSIKSGKGKGYDIITVYLAILKQDGVYKINLDSAAPTEKEVWDKIFYNLDKVSGAMQREDVEKRLSNRWDIWEFRLVLPLPSDVKSIDRVLV